MKIDELTLEEKIGQRFIFGVNNSNISDIIKLVRNNYIGGVILYRKNYKNYEEMKKVIISLKEANKNNKIPLFIAIDQEGGVVNRLPKEITRLKNIYEVSKKDTKLVKDYAKILSDILVGMGINMNFAPVVDIYNNSKSKALYHRCFYGDEDAVFKSAKEYVGATNKRLIPVIKHFPGHGATTVDTHFFIPYVFNGREILDKHIKPFDNLIANGIDALMVGHLIVRGLTGLMPASIANRFVYNYLRQEKGYDGLIITDELNMLKKHLWYHFIFMNRAIKSCSDILLVKIKDYNEGIKIINKYKKIIDNDNNCLGLLDFNVKRIIKVKEEHDVNNKIDKIGIDIDSINKEIERINGGVDG